MPSFRVLLASDRAGLKNVLLSQPRAQSCTRRLNRAFIIGTVLNVGFVVIEAFFGVVTQSLALLADAGHNLSDVLGLLLAWGASFLSQRPPTRCFTYGLRRSSILAALFNAIILLLAMGGGLLGKPSDA